MDPSVSFIGNRSTETKTADWRWWWNKITLIFHQHIKNCAVVSQNLNTQKTNFVALSYSFNRILWNVISKMFDVCWGITLFWPLDKLCSCYYCSPRLCQCSILLVRQETLVNHKMSVIDQTENWGHCNLILSQLLLSSFCSNFWVLTLLMIGCACVKELEQK